MSGNSLGQFKSVREWLTAKYLENIFNGVAATFSEGAPEVELAIIPLAELNAFLVAQGLNVLPTLDECKKLGWIEDFKLDIVETEGPTPKYLESLNVDKTPGKSYRVVGIKPEVLHGNAGKGKRKRRGRPVDTDAKADAKLCADWQAAKGLGLTRQAFARQRGINVNDIIAAQQRQKYRRQRDAE